MRVTSQGSPSQRRERATPERDVLATPRLLQSLDNCQTLPIYTQDSGPRSCTTSFLSKLTSHLNQARLLHQALSTRGLPHAPEALPHPSKVLPLPQDLTPKATATCSHTPLLPNMPQVRSVLSDVCFLFLIHTATTLHSLKPKTHPKPQNFFHSLLYFQDLSTPVLACSSYADSHQCFHSLLHT